MPLLVDSFLELSKMKLVAFARSLWQRPREQPNVKIPFLQLPAQLVGRIATFLEPADKLLLAQTCRSIRMYLRMHSSMIYLSRADYFAYLACLARELPKQWVCDYCMALHPIDKYDRPTNQWCPRSCPVYAELGFWCRGRLRSFYQIRLEHHHVQLALKYTRLQQRKYKSYLRALLQPYAKQPFNTGSSATIAHETRYSTYPRIVAGRDGIPRFLLYSVWKYFAGGRDIVFQNLGDQRICPHLLFRDGNFSEDNNNLSQSFLWALNPENWGFECRNACPRCATDFSVMLRGRNLYLQVWQDLGPEGSPLDLAWRSQTVRGGQRFPQVNYYFD
ncbi:hypothetical protein F5X97DRAFT_340257 [Nemania serpens]|nr:hypothetical protein F5X97DRAFT_340257 [Nemania serpens]